MSELDFELARQKMVQCQLLDRNIVDDLVLKSMGTIRREVFVPVQHRHRAYDDEPIPIGCGQTISQPYVVALMAENLDLRESDIVMEIGAGCGYAAAVLAQIVRKVVAIERFQELAETARENFSQLGIRNVEVHCADGSLGWPMEAPYDAILVSAAGPEVPVACMEQLKIGGLLVMPVGDRKEQHLLRVERTTKHNFVTEDLGSVRFVPLIGDQGW